MKILTSLLALGTMTALGVVLCSCGGGGASGPGSTTSVRQGGMQVQVQWPSRARLVPQAADFITFSVYHDSGLTQLIGSFSGQRPATNDATSSWIVSPRAYAPDNYFVVASAFSSSDPTHALATGVTRVGISQSSITDFIVTLASTVAQFKLTGALTGSVALDGTVTGTPALVVPGGGWGQAQSVTVEPVDSTGAALVLLSSSSTIAVTASSNIAVATGAVNQAMTQYTVGLTPNAMNPSSYVQVLYTDGGQTPTLMRVPIRVTPPLVNVTVTIPNTLGTVPTISSSTVNPLVAVSHETLTDTGTGSFTPASWTISGGNITISYANVEDDNLPFSSTATVSIIDQSGTWHGLMTPSTSTAHTLGTNTSIALDTGIVGNLTIGTSNLGSFNSGTWPSSWGVTATVGGVSGTFSPTLFATSGSATLVGTTLAGTWPSITAATLTSSTSSTNGTVSIPITFNNGANANSTGAVTATILPLTGNGSVTIH